MNIFIGVIVGGAAGFAIYKLIGCRTGACPITANPYASIIYGAVTGILITMAR